MDGVPELSPARRLRLGLFGVVGLLVLWWALTVPVFSEEFVQTESVATGVFEERTHPVSGETIRVEKREIVETPVTRSRALVNPPALDTPVNTLGKAGRLLFDADPSLAEHIGWSAFRVLIGFLISALVAVPLGIAMGLFPTLRATVLPIVSFLRPLPSIAWVPLAMIWLGAGETQKLAIIFMGSFSAALLYTIEATLKVDPGLIRAARNLGASERDLLWRVLLPAAAPSILSGLKVVLAIAWTCVISAEIVGTQVGLGALIWTSKETSDTATVLVGMASISAFVLLVDLGFTWMERKLIPWRHVESAR